MNSLIISASYTDSKEKTKPHFHDSHQLLLVTSGSATATVAEKEYQLKSGSLIFISRYEQHSVNNKSDDYSRFALEITPDTAELYSILKDLYSVLVNRPLSFSHVVELRSDYEYILNLFKELLREFTKKEPMYEAKLNNIFMMIMISIYRLTPELFSYGSADGLNVVHQIQQQFESNPEKQYTLNDLAAQHHLSTYYLSHIFKTFTGCSVMNYLLSYRLAFAKKMLVETDYNVSEIIERCGFSDFSNFSRTFKKVNGISPTKFREKYKK